MRLKPLAECECFAGRSHLIKRARCVRMQIILDQTHTRSLRVVFVDKVLHEFRIINGRTSGSHFHIPQPGMRLKGQKDTAGAIFLLRIMVAFRFARAHR